MNKMKKGLLRVSEALTFHPCGQVLTAHEVETVAGGFVQGKQGSSQEAEQAFRLRIRALGQQGPQFFQ